MLVKYPIMGLSYARGYFAICGGGGSLRSGIKNTVVRALSVALCRSPLTTSRLKGIMTQEIHHVRVRTQC